MRVLDLFSGIGGFSLGLERAGMETVAFCEIDAEAREVLNKHWPNVPVFNDVSKLKKKNLPGHIDVICGGFPCQDISVAGEMKGLKGERSGLWKEFKRLIKEIKPRYAIIENVANLRAKGLKEVIEDLWKIGYDCEWHIISARAVGAPHLRERVWIIAHPNNERREKQRGAVPDISRYPKLKRDICGSGGANRERNIESESYKTNRRHEKTLTDANLSRRTGCGMPGGIQQEFFSINGLNDKKEREVTSNPYGVGLPGSGEYSLSQSDREATRERETVDAFNDCWTDNATTSTFRFWKPFESEEHRRNWWGRIASSASYWKETRAIFCGVDDGLSKGLHTPERERRGRVKQLGNSVVPQIPQIIGQAIMEWENKN